MELLLNPALAPFTGALCILAALVALEFVLLVLGADLFHFVDDILPDLGHHDVGGVHADAHADTPSIGKVLSFVGIGKLPVVMVLMCFLATFGLAGYFLQHGAEVLSGAFLPLGAAVPAVLAFSLVLTGRVATLLARILPSEETSAVSAESLIGLVATVVYGDASMTRPATGKVADAHGNIHHIQVKASSPEELLHQGQQVQIVSLVGGFYIGTAIPEKTI